MNPSPTRVAFRHLNRQARKVLTDRHLREAERVVERLNVDQGWEVRPGHDPYAPQGYDFTDQVKVVMSFASGQSGSGAGSSTSYTPKKDALREAERIKDALTKAGFLYASVRETFHGVTVTAWPPLD